MIDYAAKWIILLYKYFFSYYLDQLQALFNFFLNFSMKKFIVNKGWLRDTQTGTSLGRL